MPTSADKAARVLEQADCLHTATEVASALDRMADAIQRDHHDTDPLVLCLMIGGLIPAGHLLSRIQSPLQIDYIHATRYRGETVGGDLEWKRLPSRPLAGRHVLLIDDILDQGLTLAAIRDYCHAEGAASVSIAVLTRKAIQRPVEIDADYVGLEVEDRYVFGFGMDYEHYLRNLDGIYALKEEPHG